MRVTVAFLAGVVVVMLLRAGRVPDRVPVTCPVCDLLVIDAPHIHTEDGCAVWPTETRDLLLVTDLDGSNAAGWAIA